MRKEISLDEMREHVGRLVYGDDWIGGLTDEEYEFLREHLPVRRIVRTDGSTVRLEHVGRCSPELARNLDRTIGRRERMGAQYVTVDSWLQDRGLLGAGTPTAVIDRNHLFDVPQSARRLDGNADREAFNKAVCESQNSSQPAQTERKRGPKPQVGPRVIVEMQDDIAQGKREELENMLEKELERRYGASREIVRNARTEVLKSIK